MGVPKYKIQDKVILNDGSIGTIHHISSTYHGRNIDTHLYSFKEFDNISVYEESIIKIANLRYFIITVYFKHHDTNELFITDNILIDYKFPNKKSIINNIITNFKIKDIALNISEISEIDFKEYTK